MLTTHGYSLLNHQPRRTRARRRRRRRRRRTRKHTEREQREGSRGGCVPFKDLRAFPVDRSDHVHLRRAGTSGHCRQVRVAQPIFCLPPPVMPQKHNATSLLHLAFWLPSFSGEQRHAFADSPHLFKLEETPTLLTSCEN